MYRSVSDLLKVREVIRAALGDTPKQRFGLPAAE
jgi:hypothetical protein